MIPKSLSATAMNTANSCLARYHAENYVKANNISKPAASNGTAIHSALEAFITKFFVEPNARKPKFEDLEMLYKYYYMKNFPQGEEDDELYKVGIKCVKDWFYRADYADGRTIISTEARKQFPLRTSKGIIPFTYIIDRLDFKDGFYEVIDYKSSVINVSATELNKKLQGKAYALALLFEHPEIADDPAGGVWVTFEMLRYAPVSVFFTVEECRQTYQDLVVIAENILAAEEPTPENPLPETLNQECTFCVRKASCVEIRKNIDVGGIFGLSLQEQIDMRAQIEFQRTAMGSLMKELDEVIEPAIVMSDEDGATEYNTNFTKAFFKTSSHRVCSDPRLAQKLVGDDLWNRFAKTEMGIGQYDKMLKDPSLSEDTVKQLKELVKKEYGEPRLNFVALTPEVE